MITGERIATKSDKVMVRLRFEAVEASVKAYYLTGKISREELNLIFKNIE